MKIKHLSVFLAAALSVSAVQAQQTLNLAELQQGYAQAANQGISFVQYLRQQVLTDEMIAANSINAEQTLTSLLALLRDNQEQVAELLDSVSASGFSSDQLLTSAVGAGIDPTLVSTLIADTATAAPGAATGPAPTPGVLGLGAGTGGGGATASNN
ncbi:hypothetical protein [Bowmanella yangjiangensis]|uniref:Uncharacterized protein n=1 Tax=Bowmanella yangjiangensis TaxID=2811230 RepID=A0ABS3CVQ5_9ALTE|nr:hypothetical protein [Bowmanella yangjiangensis]MBN7820231.1 hypothetical protein [Bowmanella yangjiangensis]